MYNNLLVVRVRKNESLKNRLEIKQQLQDTVKDDCLVLVTDAPADKVTFELAIASKQQVIKTIKS